MRATKHAPRDPSHVLERRHSLADIFERGGVVHVERHSAVNAHVVVHFVCGGLMIPVILARDWAAATPFARNAFILGTLCDVGFDIYHGLRVATATFASRDFLGRLGWEKNPAAMMVLTILHHTLSVSMVIPMNHAYIELDDYRFICFSLLFAAAVCFSLNSYKMTLDVTVRGDFVVFKVITVVQLAIIFYTRIWNWFQAVYRICQAFSAAGDVSYYRGGLCCAGFMTVFNLALMNDAVGGSESDRRLPGDRVDGVEVDAVDATHAGRNVRQVDPEAAARAHDAF